MPRAAARRQDRRGRTSPGGDSSPAHGLAMALRAAYLALHRQTDAWLTRAGVTADQFVVLAALARGGADTQRDLVKRTASDPSTLRAMLVLLERRGFVTRRTHPTDRRARSVRLTARGRRLSTEAWSASDPLRECLVTTLRPGEIEALTNALDRMATLVRRATPPARRARRATARPRRLPRTRAKGA